MNYDELKYLISLGLLRNIGPVKAKKIIEYYGSATEFFNLKRKDLFSLGLLQDTADDFFSKTIFKKADSEIDFIIKNNIHAICFNSSEYPRQLINCSDSPYLLFVKGQFPINNSLNISIVGSRNCSLYGENKVDEIIEGLTEFSPIIISGLALGIDIKAHTSALKNKLSTYAVLGHGLDLITPRSHLNIAKQMLSNNGGLITEFLSNTPFNKINFPKRNRIIAGLCDLLIVIESKQKGGALITAEFANDYSKDVLALPGKSSDNFSAGCNYLIKNNKAALFENIQDVIEFLNLNQKLHKNKNSINKEKNQEKIQNLSKNELLIYDLIKQFEKISLEYLCNCNIMKINELQSALMQMELLGIVKSMPGNHYKLG